MLVVAFVSFSLFTFVGDPINNMVGEETSDQERAELRETLGLNDPIHIQFTRFVINCFFSSSTVGGFCFPALVFVCFIPC